MSAWTTRALHVANLARLSSAKSSCSTLQAASFIHRRGLAGAGVGGGGDHQGRPPKVNFWEDPMRPYNWKQDQFVVVSLIGGGLLFYGLNKYSKNRDENEEKQPERIEQTAH